MLLSIIVPVYNMAKDQKLNHCIDSLINQTIKDYEIIAVDDCSSDNSLEILRDYEKRYKGKIRVLQNEINKRQGGARNTGLRASNAVYVGFMDADDWAAPTMYEKLVNKAILTGADFVGCDFSKVSSYTFEPGEIEINNTAEQCGVLDDDKYRLHILSSGSMVVKIYERKILMENDLFFPEDIFYEDNAAAEIWPLYFKHFEHVDEPLYFYYTVPESTTHSVTWDRCVDRKTAGEIMITELKKRGFYEKYKNEIDYRFTELFYQVTLFSYMYSGKRRRIKNIRNLKKDFLESCPDYRTNPYYEERMGEEDKKLIELHMKSDFLFYFYYILLFSYRKFIKKLRKK